MSDTRRRVMWAVAVLCGVIGVGLVLMAVLVDLDTADRTASVVGAVVALVGLVMSAYALLQAPANAGGVTRAYGRGAVAAGGSVSGNAIGARSKVTAGSSPATPAVPPTNSITSALHVEARGDGAVASGGDVSGNAIGDDSEAR
ncbi:hypothetical protein GCM10010415_73340 [Streptomyces atrovirens]